jgi:hypothetical protein
MVAMPMPDPNVAAATTVARGDCGAAFDAEFPPLRHHAGPHPAFVRDEVMAQPHGIRGAGLTNVDDLGRGRPDAEVKAK